jgi:hypothetical protein
MAFRIDLSMDLKSKIVLPVKRAIVDRLLSIGIRLAADLHFHKGFTIAHLSSEQRCDAIHYIKAAIDLIESNDSRRFARVKRSVAFVCSTNPKNTWTFYSPRSKICVVNVGRVAHERPEKRDLVGTIAALLVSSSVDGLLCEKGIFPAKGNGPKIKRLRHAEMTRFLQRVVDEEAESQRIFPPISHSNLVMSLTEQP